MLIPRPFRRHGSGKTWRLIDWRYFGSPKLPQFPCLLPLHVQPRRRVARQCPLLRSGYLRFGLHTISFIRVDERNWVGRILKARHFANTERSASPSYVSSLPPRSGSERPLPLLYLPPTDTQLADFRRQLGYSTRRYSGNYYGVYVQRYWLRWRPRRVCVGCIPLFKTFTKVKNI